MKITTLIENTKIDDKFKEEHGLSFYIELKDKNVLFDLGQKDKFLYNAKILNKDIEAVDFAYISHGHYDHGGGLVDFLKTNKKAPVYLNENAFGDFYSKRIDKLHYIGLSKELVGNKRIVPIKDDFKIEDNIYSFCDVEIKNMFPSNNKNLFVLSNNEYVNDTFQHEQYLVIKEKEKYVLFSGCSHRGIKNIMEAFNAKFGLYPNVVIGGFHLYNKSNDIYESDENIIALGNYLNNIDAVYYTGHCTGEKAYNKLKEKLDNKINYLATGSIIEI